MQTKTFESVLIFVHVCVCVRAPVSVLRLKTYAVHTYGLWIISLHLCPVLEHVQDWCINVYYMCMDGLTGGSMDGWIHFLHMHPLMRVDVFNLLSSVCYKLISSAPCQKRASRCKPEGLKARTYCVAIQTLMPYAFSSCLL